MNAAFYIPGLHYYHNFNSLTMTHNIVQSRVSNPGELISQFLNSLGTSLGNPRTLLYCYAVQNCPGISSVVIDFTKADERIITKKVGESGEEDTEGVKNTNENVTYPVCVDTSICEDQGGQVGQNILKHE